MLLTILFALLLAITVGLTGLQLLGFQVLNSLIIMIVIDFMALAANLQVKKKNPGNPSPNVIPKLESIEKTCSDILHHVNTVSIKDDLKRNKDDLTYLLEKIARKTLDLEQKIDAFGGTLTNSMLNINSRVKKLEAPEIEEMEEAVSEPEKQSVSVGEIIYVDEDGS
jgi:hypothetical protein